MDYLAGAHTATDVAVDVQFPNLSKNKDEFDYSSSDPSSVGGGDDLKVAVMEHDDLLDHDRRTSSSSAFESELIRTPPPPPESSSLTTATTTTTSLSTPHSSPYSTTHAIPATAITATTTTTTATPTSFTDIVSATASPRGKKRNSSGEPICNSNYDTNNITTKTIDTSSIGITTGSSPGPGPGLGLGLGPRSVSVSGSVSGIGPSSSFGSGHGSSLNTNTNTHRPLGPAHLEHDYSLARTALSRAISQAVYDLYGFSIPVRDASVEARRPSGQGCLQAIRKHPLVRRACVGVDRADRALEDALGRGERWENTGVPDEWRWGSEVLRPFEWAWVPPEVKVGGRGKGGGGVGKRARMEVDTELIIESRTRGQQKRKAESGLGLGLSSGSRFGFGFGSGGRLGLGSGGGLGSGDRVDGRRSVDRGVVVDVDQSVVDVDVDRRNKVRKVSGLGDASSSDLRSTLGVGMGREAEGKFESRFASESELVRDSIVSGAAGASSLSLSSTTVISATTTTMGAVTVTPAIIVIGAPTVTASTTATAPVSKHLPPPTSSSSSISSSSSPSSYASLSVSNPGTPVEKRKRGRPRKIPRVEGCSVSAPVPVGSSSLSVTGVGAGGRVGTGAGAGNGNRDMRGTRDTRGVKGVMQGAAVPMSISASSFYGVPSGMNTGSTSATVVNGGGVSAGVGGATATPTVPAKRPRGRPRKHFVRIPLESLMTPIIPV